MKNSYILLRNNKESTALSIEQLQEIGLKETDLIWVECQSMDWRSPFEIAELKNLVSAGNSEDKKHGNENLMSLQVANRESLLKKQDTEKTWTDPYIKNLEKYSHPEHVSLSGLEKPANGLFVNKSSSPGEIKTMNLKNPIQIERPNKKAFAIHLPEQFKKIILYTGLILSGALLMLLVKNLGSKKPAAVQQTKASPEKSAATTATLSKALNDTGTIAAANIAGPYLPTEKSSVTAIKERKRPVRATNNIPLETDATTENPDSSDNVEKSAKPVTEIKVKPVTIEDISSKIALETNDYTVGTLGGIRNLTMTLQNGSKYMLDKVTVELKYLNPDGKIIKTAQLYFQNVRPQDMASLEVNKSKRGIKVEYKVTDIECKALTSPQPVLAGPGTNSTN